MPNRSNGLCLDKLRRRIEALEKTLSEADEAAAAMSKNALYSISQDTLELLICATLATRQGRQLTESEASAKQAYASAVESECRRSGLTVRRIPDVAEMISLAAIRQISDSDLRLCIHGIRAMLQGFEPSATELVALRESRATLEAQYQRAGFSSEAEFARWYGKTTGSRKGKNAMKPRAMA